MDQGIPHSVVTDVDALALGQTVPADRVAGKGRLRDYAVPAALAVHGRPVIGRPEVLVSNVVAAAALIRSGGKETR